LRALILNQLDVARLRHYPHTRLLQPLQPFHGHVLDLDRHDVEVLPKLEDRVGIAQASHAKVPAH